MAVFQILIQKPCIMKNGLQTTAHSGNMKPVCSAVDARSMRLSILIGAYAATRSLVIALKLFSSILHVQLM
jgi:hypothetical protein